MMGKRLILITLYSERKKKKSYLQFFNGRDVIELIFFSKLTDEKPCRIESNQPTKQIT